MLLLLTLVVVDLDAEHTALQKLQPVAELLLLEVKVLYEQEMLQPADILALAVVM
jgi:hypothetical protein